jgi:hypothetical protein
MAVAGYFSGRDFLHGRVDDVEEGGCFVGAWHGLAWLVLYYRIVIIPWFAFSRANVRLIKYLTCVYLRDAVKYSKEVLLGRLLMRLGVTCNLVALLVIDLFYCSKYKFCGK